MHLERVAAFTASGAVVLAIVAGLVALAGERSALRNAHPGELATLASMAVAAVALRLLIPAYERIYTDEVYAMWAASDMLEHAGWISDIGYGKSYGWPALLGLAFALGPDDPETATTASLVCGIATLAVLHAAGAVWAGRDGGRAGLAAGAFVAASPVHALWSRTAESNVGGAFTLAMLLLSAGLWRRDPRARNGVLLVALTAVACATRPEALVLAALLALVHLSRDRRLALLVTMGVVIAAPNLWLYGASHITENLERITAFGAGAARLHPWKSVATEPLQPLIMILALIGLVVGVRTARAPTLVLAAWLVLTVALLSAAGTGALASPERFLLAPLLPAALLAGLAVSAGFHALAKRWRWAAPGGAVVVAGGLAAFSLSGLDEARRGNAAYELQHRLPELLEDAVPGGYTLIANRPEMYRGTTDLHVAASADILDGRTPLGGRAVYIWDLTCSEWHFQPFADQCALLRARAAPTPRTVFPPTGPEHAASRGREALLFDIVRPLDSEETR